jgi:hypothetical protein
MPANLANTCSVNSRNNCRIKHKTGSNYFSIETIKKLKAGDEVTVSYGCKFTNIIRRAQLRLQQQKIKAAIHGNAVVSCNRCSKRMQFRKLRNHRCNINFKV